MISMMFVVLIQNQMINIMIKILFYVYINQLYL